MKKLMTARDGDGLSRKPKDPIMFEDHDGVVRWGRIIACYRADGRLSYFHVEDINTFEPFWKLARECKRKLIPNTLLADLRARDAQHAARADWLWERIERAYNEATVDAYRATLDAEYPLKEMV